MTTLEGEHFARASVSVHFRILTDVYDTLEGEAKKRKVNLNTLVNQILSNYASDELLYEEMGYVRMTKIAYRAHLDVIPDDKLSELGNTLAKTTPTAIMMEREGVVNLDALLDFLRLLSRSGWFSFHQARIGGKETISLAQDLGPRQSVVLGHFVTGLFAQVGVPAKVMTTNSSVVIVL